MKNGFTLAEVLVTLGIIGVVAALTIPSLVENYKKKVVVTRLKNFYSNMNQAIRLSEVENGSCVSWQIYFSNNTTTNSKKFFEKYLIKYLNSVESFETIKKGSETFNFLKLTDGSAFMYVGFNTTGSDISFHYYPDAEKIDHGKYGRDFFAFVYSVNSSRCSFEPFTANHSTSTNNDYKKWNGTRQDLISHPRYGCRKGGYSSMFCAKLIQYDGWRISKDYPW